MSKTADLRNSINEKLIVALENDKIPWRRLWASPQNSGRHRNFQSNRPYSGLNPWLCELHNIEHGFSSPLWATFNQWKSAGCFVKKRPSHIPPGRWGCQVLLYKPYSKTVMNRESGEEEERRLFYATTFTVFSAEQVEGEAVEKLLAVPEHDHGNDPDFQPAEQLLTAAVESGIKIRYEGNRAMYVRPRPEAAWPYHRDGDYIVMPQREHFYTLAGFFETLFHELGHHSEIRVGYDHLAHGYAATELVAELTACYLGTELRIPTTGVENHARYLKSWLEAMRVDSSFVFKVSGWANKTTEHLLSLVRKPEGDGQPAGDDEPVVAAVA